MEWLPEEHLAYFIPDVVGELDLGQVEQAIRQKDARGEQPCAPGMMRALPPRHPGGLCSGGKRAGFHAGVAEQGPGEGSV